MGFAVKRCFISPLLLVYSLFIPLILFLLESNDNLNFEKDSRDFFVVFRPLSRPIKKSIFDAIIERERERE